MNTFTQVITEKFHIVSCYTCGCRFGIGGQLHRRVVEKAQGHVYCPACGKGTAWCESQEQKEIAQLKKKLQWEAKECARQMRLRDSAEASLRATKGSLTKLRKRVGVGTCPCCKRTFKQLKAHMESQHPEYTEQTS